MIGFFVKYIQKKTSKQKKPIRARKKNLRRTHQNITKISIQLQKQKSSMITIPSSQLYHLHSSRIKPETLYNASTLKRKKEPTLLFLFFFLSLLLLLLLPCKFHKIKKYILNSPTLIEIVKLNVVAVVF